MPSKNPEEYARGLLDLDRVVEEEADGMYVIPIPEDASMYNIRALDKYCKERNIDAYTLTDEELEQFIVKE